MSHFAGNFYFIFLLRKGGHPYVPLGSTFKEPGFQRLKNLEDKIKPKKAHQK